MKEGWKLIKLDELCVIERGGSPRPIDAFLTADADGINWIKISDATASGKYIYKTEQKIKPEGAKRSRIVNEGDFILSNSMSFGRPYIMKTNGCIHDGWLVLRQPKVNPDYLYLVLGSDFVYQQFDRLASGSTVRNLNIGLVKSVEIPVPSELEQQRIVAILDEAFEAIAAARANAEQNRQNARALFESYLQSVFSQRGNGWVEKTLGDIGKVSMCKRVLKEQTSAIGDIPFYKIGSFGKKADSFISTELYSKYKEKYSFPKKGDILLSAAGTIGRRVIFDGNDAYFQDSNIVWIANDQTQVLNCFLYHFYGACEWNATKGATILRLYNDDLRRIVIAFPTSLDVQKSIAAQMDLIFDATQRLESLYQRKISALDELKQSLLQQAFSGQL
ncbi:restriction endonuclease subunit S [Aeromonas veronii]|uniref:restriction endonuclease subunit S n=1 Tax=Aeromonas veronii TaxID=654 RepID=UPI00028060F3|nr:restriction endonuclease subunit S [Aeromonas veronii]EKB16211.1 hypothetical protein HMPREF1169_00320 [Aeromonas veronii AER397]